MSGIYIGSYPAVPVADLSQGDYLTVVYASEHNVRLLDWGEVLTLFSPPFSDATALLKGSSDDTKKVLFEVDANVPSDTTVTLVCPGQDGTIPLLEAANVWTGSNIFSTNVIVLGDMNSTGSVTGLSMGATLITPITMSFGRLIPPTLNSSQNDYAPGNSLLLNLSASTAVNVTGLAYNVDYDFRLLYNSGSFTITLKNEDTGSTAANRFHTTTGADLSLSAGKLVMLVYMPSPLSRWVASLLN